MSMAGLIPYFLSKLCHCLDQRWCPTVSGAQALLGDIAA